jgi:hypothetical protein
MRKTTAVALSFLLVLLAFTSAREETPSTHPRYKLEGQPVGLDFKVSKINTEGVELALAKQRNREMFVQFSVSVTEDGVGVVMDGLTNKSRMNGNVSKRHLPDFPFLKASEGEPVLDFAFEHQLARDEAGNPVMRMSYTGIPVPLVRTLTVKRPVTLPPFLSEMFDIEGPIQFQPGVYRVDAEIDGFWIPIKILRDK